MAVEIDRHAHARMSKPLLRDLGMHSGCQHVGGVAVAQVVQPDRRQAMPSHEFDEGMGERPRLYRLSILAGHDVVIVSEPHAGRQQPLSLCNPVPAQFVNDQRRQGHSAGLAALGLLLPDAAIGLFGTRGHGQLTAI